MLQLHTETKKSILTYICICTYVCIKSRIFFFVFSKHLNPTRLTIYTISHASNRTKPNNTSTSSKRIAKNKSNNKKATTSWNIKMWLGEIKKIKCWPKSMRAFQQSIVTSVSNIDSATTRTPSPILSCNRSLCSSYWYFTFAPTLRCTRRYL